MSSSQPRMAHDTIQTIANVASTLVAVFALIYSTISFQTTVNSSNRDQASRDWAELLKMMSENSDLNLDYRVMDRSSVSSAQAEANSRRWHAYMNRMYFYMNSVVESDGVENWKTQIKMELANHGALQCDEYLPVNGATGFRASARYSDDFVKIVDDFYRTECPSITQSRDEMLSNIRKAQTVGQQ
jgi:hypothetical protein